MRPRPRGSGRSVPRHSGRCRRASVWFDQWSRTAVQSDLAAQRTRVRRRCGTSGPVEQFGVLATLSRWRPRVQIPSGPHGGQGSRTMTAGPVRAFPHHSVRVEGCARRVAAVGMRASRPPDRVRAGPTEGQPAGPAPMPLSGSWARPMADQRKPRPSSVSPRSYRRSSARAPPDTGESFRRSELLPSMNKEQRRIL